MKMRTFHIYRNLSTGMVSHCCVVHYNRWPVRERQVIAVLAPNVTMAACYAYEGRPFAPGERIGVLSITEPNQTLQPTEYWNGARSAYNLFWYNGMEYRETMRYARHLDYVARTFQTIDPIKRAVTLATEPMFQNDRIYALRLEPARWSSPIVYVYEPIHPDDLAPPPKPGDAPMIRAVRVQLDPHRLVAHAGVWLVPEQQPGVDPLGDRVDRRRFRVYREILFQVDDLMRPPLEARLGEKTEAFEIRCARMLFEGYAIYSYPYHEHGAPNMRYLVYRSRSRTLIGEPLGG